jgi:hypothetical protein
MQQVIKSQQERRFIATLPGAQPAWDYVAYQGDDERYVRKDGVDATKSRLRLPRAASMAPDMPELSHEMIESMMSGKIDFHKDEDE